MKFTFYTFIFCFSLWSCNNQEKHGYHHDHSHDNESNVHMNETSFEDLVKMMVNGDLERLKSMKRSISNAKD